MTVPFEIHVNAEEDRKPFSPRGGTSPTCTTEPCFFGRHHGPSWRQPQKRSTGPISPLLTFTSCGGPIILKVMSTFVTSLYRLILHQSPKSQCPYVGFSLSERLFHFTGPIAAFFQESRVRSTSFFHLIQMAPKSCLCVSLFTFSV